MRACKLCLAPDCEPAARSQGRDLLHCPACELVFVPEAEWVSLADERARYAHHHNTPANTGYVRFLGQVVDVVCALAGPGARVLDFGSGARAVLTELLRARGRDCVAHDPLYDLGKDALAENYDAIVLCEVIEHLRDLRGELARIARCVRPGGAVVVRTQRYPSLAELPAWWYARDVTHINFFAEKTLAVAASACGLVARATALPDVGVWQANG